MTSCSTCQISELLFSSEGYREAPAIDRNTHIGHIGRVSRTKAIAVTWDGRDSSGNAVSSGLYFYRLDVRGKVVTRSSHTPEGWPTGPIGYARWLTGFLLVVQLADLENQRHDQQCNK